MFTEEYAIVHNGIANVSTVVSSQEVSNVIEAIKTTLISAGWSLVESLPPYGSMFINFWFVSLHLFAIQSGKFQTDLVQFVNDSSKCGCGDQCFHTAGFFGACCGGWFSGTINDIIDEIWYHTPWRAEWDAASQSLLLVLKEPDEVGPVCEDATRPNFTLPITEYNQPIIHYGLGVGSGDEGPDLNIAGGGYRLRSQEANGHTDYELWITQRHGTGNVLIKIVGPGGTVEHTLYTSVTTGADGTEYTDNLLGETRPLFKIIANPYQLAIIDLANPTSDFHSRFNWGGNSLFVSAPWTDNPNITSCMFCVGPGQLMTNNVWTLHACSVWLNGTLNTFVPGVRLADNLTAYIGMAARNSHATYPLLDSREKPFIQNAYVSAARSTNDEGMIIGKLWDCFMLSQYAPAGSLLNVFGTNYTCISGRNTTSPSSLWMAS